MLTKKQTVVAISVALGMSINVAQAVTTMDNNFTMLHPGNDIAGGTNDVTFTWDGTYNTDPATAVTNASLFSPSIFGGSTWIAYNIMIYGPGTYTISTVDTLGGPGSGCPFPEAERACHSGGTYENIAVGGDQVMGHMKFAWSINQGIDLINIWNHEEMFGPSPIFAGFVLGGTVDVGGDPNQVWNGMSIDGDGDGINGFGFIDGPFPGFAGNFNVMGLTPIPIPAAFWLFGSGLMGLLGVAYRKRKA